MGTQLYLPAGWARNFQSKQLSSLRQDVLDAKVEIRTALERLAEKHHIQLREIDRSMGWADDGPADLIYETERELQHEIEERDPV